MFIQKLIDIISLVNSSRDQTIQRNIANTISRQLISSNLDKYSTRLNQLKKTTDPKIKEIACKSAIAYMDILDKIKCYERFKPDAIRNSQSENISHIANDITILWYHNYSSRLGRSSSQLVFQDMREILHIQPHEDNDLNTKSKLQIVKRKIDHITNIFNHTNNNKYPISESARSNPQRFNTLLSSYFSRLSEHQNLYQECISIAQPIFNHVLLLKEEFENNHKIINQLFEENKLEIVKINESEELYNAMITYQCDMAFFQDFYLFDNNLKLEAEHLKLNQVLQILFCLFVFKVYGAWGDNTLFPV